MLCPFCGFTETRVNDSRPAMDGSAIRRRRECAGCGKRFTTYERVEELPLIVVKKDGRRESFDRGKLLSGLRKAFQKRPVSAGQMECIAGEIERELRNSMEAEVQSRFIGELVMERLRRIDEVAYVRFASVYRDFRDAECFMEELKNLLDNNKDSSGGE